MIQDKNKGKIPVIERANGRDSGRSSLVHPIIKAGILNNPKNSMMKRQSTEAEKIAVKFSKDEKFEGRKSNHRKSIRIPPTSKFSRKSVVEGVMNVSTKMGESAPMTKIEMQREKITNLKREINHSSSD
jgi:hypothetical protein